LPNEWRHSVAQTLNDNESVIAVLELDLNEQLHFAKGLVCLTNQGLIASKEEFASWSRWPFSDDLKLQLHDHAGVANLELISKAGRLVNWRFTLAQNPVANRLVQHFQVELAKFLGKFKPELAEATQPLCPTCWVPLPPDQDECPACSSENLTPPSTWTLLRLWRFAKPYKGQLLAGFALTLASTAATLVPPYLTMPLMDDILLPYQNGQDIDVNLTLLYLGALLGAAILAWVLGWAKTYILALVSERIGADLRTTTYQHLMKLSLEYFGGKRTGDLMARIGSESDRICLFLSMHLLDFATDVLMILMTAAILISIDPWLALVTLLPLPFIGWAIHVVRDKLRYGFEKIDRIWSEVTSVLADTIPGVRVVKAFAQEERESDRFRLANEHNLAVNDRVNRVWALFSPTITLLTEIGLLVVWAFGIWQIANDAITVGMLTACLAYIGRFYTRLDSMSRIVAFTQQAATASKRIFDILDHV
jgi:ATP-binding cassette subfamily B protein